MGGPPSASSALCIQFTAPHAPWPVPAQLLVLGAVFIAVGLAGARQWLDRLSGTIFAGLALRLVVDGVK